METIKIQIKHRWMGIVMFEYSSVANTLSRTVIEALKSDADLCSANLRGVHLCGANLRGVHLCCANLWCANLRGAHLRGADLRGADLCGADLCGADLRDADLRDADLCDADLRGADLCGADLCDANLRGAKGCYMSCPSDGSFIGWKKEENMIVKLHIPEDAQRSSAGGIKCRCNKAIVLEIQNIDGTISEKQMVHSTHDPNFAYTVGAMVEVTDFDHNRWNECAPGIHFFIDRRAATEY